LVDVPPELASIATILSSVFCRFVIIQSVQYVVDVYYS